MPHALTNPSPRRAASGDPFGRASSDRAPGPNRGPAVNPDPIAESTLQQAVAEHSEGLMTFATRLLRDRTAAEDVAQDSFLALYRHLHEVPQNAVRPWLYRVARNLCLDQLRRRRFNLKLFRDVGRDDTDYSPSVVDTTEDRPDQLAETREAQTAIEEAIDQLPLKFKETFLLCEVRGLSYEEAGSILGCPVKTISTRLFRARQRFRTAVSRLIEV